MAFIAALRAGPLGVRDFRLLLCGFTLGQLLGPLQFLTQILWVQAYAPEDVWLILVALIGASRGVGALTFGLYGGALADRYDRRKLLMAMQLALTASTVLIALLMYAEIRGPAAYAVFFALTFVSAGLQAVDAPTRLAIVPDVLGAERVAAGMSINQVAAQLALPVAMFGAGFIIDAFGFASAYLLSGSGHVLALLFLWFMNYQPKHAVGGTGRYGFRETLFDVREGIAYARGHTTVFWVIGLMVAMMSLGFPATANLGPTWITTVVGVETRELGYVVFTWGLGSLLAAVTLTVLSDIQRRGRLIAGGALLFAAGFVIFVAEPTVTNAVIGNLCIGAGMTTASVSSTVLIQKLVPNEVRGRIMSLFQLNFGFAQVMTMPVAVLAQSLTLPVLFPLMGWATLAVVVLILVGRPQIARA